MPSDDARKLPRRYNQQIRVVATILSAAFALPVLFVFGVAVRELSRSPEPPNDTAPPPTPPAPPSPPPL